LTPNKRRVLVALADVDHRARLEAQPVEHGAVVLQRHFVFGAAVHEFEQALRHAL
jgi:hypothetical protein